MDKPFLGALAGVLLLCAAGCGDGARHDGQGLVLKVDSQARVLTVSHEPIPGVMDAMVMALPVRGPFGIGDVAPGDRIAFRMHVGGERTVIDRITVLSAQSSSVVFSASGGAALPPEPLAIGDAVPSFTLTDHRGAPVTPAALHGRVVVVGFIYTRCPLPDYCPRVVTNLNALRNRFGAELGQDLALLTLTFDPKHDTPEVLARFAASYGADVPGWHFLTGTPEEVGRVCHLFGVDWWPEEGLITHTLQTAVIDRDGRLAALVQGLDLPPRQLGDLVELLLRD